MPKTLTDYCQENYIVNSFCLGLDNRWCMSNSCSTCGAMDLRNELLKNAISDLADDEKKALLDSRKFYPRTSNLPEELLNKVLISHIVELSKIETSEIDQIRSCIDKEKNYHYMTFDAFIRFVVEDIRYCLGVYPLRDEKITQLKKGITSEKVLNEIDKINNRY